MWKSLVALTVALVVWRCSGSGELTDQMMLYLFEDCCFFNDPCKFEGFVCGSDGQTYANKLYLQCRNYKLELENRVWVKHGGRCTPHSHPCPYSPFYAPVCGSDNVTCANMEALSCKASRINCDIAFKHEGACEGPYTCAIDDCPGGICATNGLTYSNINEIIYLRKFNKDLNILHEGGCSLFEAGKAFTSCTSACSLASNCRMWNPMCGADGITYPNLFVLRCYKPHMSVQFAGECNSTIFAACRKAAEDPKGTCADTCDAVCGNDGVTYPTKNHLICATKFNKHLRQEHEGCCTDRDDPCKTPSLSNGGQPVCGSDGLSYVTPAALWCFAKYHRPSLKYVHDGPCLSESDCSL